MMRRRTYAFKQGWPVLSRSLHTLNRFQGTDKSKMTLETIDAHAGLPARVVLGGHPQLRAESAYQLREIMMTEHDHFRKVILEEPRGMPTQNVNFIFPPTPNSPEASFAFVIGENNGIYPISSGHNTICVATALLESGLIPMCEPTTNFVLEAPGGPLKMSAECGDGKVKSVTFRNVPSFVPNGGLDLEVDVPGGVGKVPVDIAWGGMWYAIVDAAVLGLDLSPSYGADIVRLGEMIKVATRDQFPFKHPVYDYSGPDIMAFRGPPSQGSGAHAKNAVVMSTGSLDWDNPSTWKGNIDRSPCGSGTSAIMATMHARGELTTGENFIHESIVGCKFIGKIIEETKFEGTNAIIPEITGKAWVTGQGYVYVDEQDPFQTGFTIGDIWG